MRVSVVPVAAVAIGCALAACGGSGGGSSSADRAATSTAPATSQDAATTAVPLAPPPAETDIEAAGATRIADLGQPDWLAIAGGSTWAAGVGDGVGRLDPVTGALRDSVAVPGAVCLAMDVGFGSLWVGSCGPEPEHPPDRSPPGEGDRDDPDRGERPLAGVVDRGR